MHTAIVPGSYVCVITIFVHFQAIDEPIIAQKGQFREIEIESTEYTFISATKPVLVVQYSKTQLNKNEEEDKGKVKIQ